MTNGDAEVARDESLRRWLCVARAQARMLGATVHTLKPPRGWLVSRWSFFAAAPTPRDLATMLRRMGAELRDPPA